PIAMRLTPVLFLSTSFLLSFTLPAQEKFVPVQGGELPGRPGVRVENFEIADAPLTNAQYAEFIRSTGHRAPEHFTANAPPAGFENHPVIFVNRYDVYAYLQWRSNKEGRIYRLPMSAEHEYAAKAGRDNLKFVWGDSAPTGQANFDDTGNRDFSDWKRYLKPVKSYQPNPWGLHDMSGNVWQMVGNEYELAGRQWIFRLTHPMEKDSGVAGGSWARSAAYLPVNSRSSTSAGIRHPDLGFRLVREPLGSTHFKRQPRRLVALPTQGGIFLSWQMLPGDPPAYHVYRSPRLDAAGIRITSSPITGATSFIDTSAPAGPRLHYRIRAVAPDGKESAPSEWASVTAGAAQTNVAAVFDPSPAQGACSPMFGDLDGDGKLDVLFRCNNGIAENTRDPGLPVELEAFTSYGKQLWRRPLIDYDNCYGNANNSPVLIYDFNGDGRAEVAARMLVNGSIDLAILDGLTGKLLRRTPWPKMATDHSGTSTRVHMSVAYLDGKRPSLITQTGLYENERFHAWDPLTLRQIWEFNSYGATNGSGSHHIDIADVDGDGLDEVFDGTTVLNPNGTMKWSIYRAHPDIVAIKHILPGTKGRQVFYVVETSTHAGAYLVDAATGKIIWKVNREDDPRWTHAHIGWAADISPAHPGMEMLTNRDGHLAKETVVFGSDGKILMEGFPARFRPVNWTGGPARDLVSPDTRELMAFDGTRLTPSATAAPSTQACSVIMTADLLGDYRDEIVCSRTSENGRRQIVILTNPTPSRKEITRTASREYRLWLARNIGAGYGSYFEWQPE
ncbi:MAG: SUMF1/EgtB/PvdO family nonheme iron enzyme, partial [Bryobacteraceae bacterium]|nr:SUMF1/EgtB/PvdO family nonheme iron enzyme [Bryobacteraceae bacterium]